MNVGVKLATRSVKKLSLSLRKINKYKQAANKFEKGDIVINFQVAHPTLYNFDKFPLIHSCIHSY